MLELHVIPNVCSVNTEHFVFPSQAFMFEFELLNSKYDAW